jgi:hypothetical protein
LDSLMNVALKYRDGVDAAVMMPRINWRRPRNERRVETGAESALLVEASLETVGGFEEKSNGRGRRVARRTRAG